MTHDAEIEHARGWLKKLRSRDEAQYENWRDEGDKTYAEAHPETVRRFETLARGLDALANEPKLRANIAEAERLKEVWRSCSFNNETFFSEFEERVRAVIKALRQETPTAVMQNACDRLDATFYHNLKVGP